MPTRPAETREGAIRQLRLTRDFLNKDIDALSGAVRHGCLRVMIRVLAVLAVVLAACTLAAEAEDAPKPVKLITVEVPSGEVTRRFFGRAVARRTVDLAFQTAGQIVRFPAVEGRIVPEGDTIAELDLEPFRLAVRQARLERDRAVRNAERLQALEGSAASPATVEDAATEAGLAEIALARAERALAQATLTAPFDALVARREVASFTTVAAGAPVVRLHDMSELRIGIEVPEILFQRAGRDPEVVLWARFPADGRLLPVEVREYRTETSRIGQTYRVTLGMAPPEDFTVLPGASVTVLATLKRAETRIAVPASAVVIAADGSTSVMVFHAEDGDVGTLEARPVTLAAGRDGEIRVEDGLAPGTEIVAAGTATLEHGQWVRRFGGFPE